MNIEKTRKFLEKCSQIVSVYSPLTSFIAVNPLWDMTDSHFITALQAFGSTKDTLDEDSLKLGSTLICQKIGFYRFESAYEYIKKKNIEVLSTIFSKSANYTEKDSSQYLGCSSWVNYLDAPEIAKGCFVFSDRLETICFLLENLRIDTDDCEEYFKCILKSVYGFSSLSKWVNSCNKNPWLQTDLTLADIVSIWLWHEWRLATELNFKNENLNPTEKSNPVEFDLFNESMLHCEKSYQKKLISRLSEKKENPDAENEVQAIFCIDTRSEVLRRKLEKEPGIKTYGYAGFFGFGFSIKEPGERNKLQCPALLTPKAIVDIKRKQENYVKFSQGIESSFSQTKKGLLSSLSFFEFFGFLYMIPYLGKTFYPNIWSKISSLFVKREIKEQDILLNELSDRDAADAAKEMLTSIGLTTGFCKTIVICGHQSVSENNPYSSSLDCGACGGNSGLINAIVAARMLNDSSVRDMLAKSGIEIPESTNFIAACHRTTYDKVVVYSDNNKLSSLFDRACRAVRDEKVTRFPMLTHLKKRQFNWAELVPEYGLVNNAAMIIGPRWLSKDENLEGRVFLHSYEASLDSSGAILESIMLAPMVVAHWINMQYYFSTVSPKYFSAGNKSIHNIIPGVGVMEGNISDLKIGLPLQSLFYRGEKLHSPQRLVVVIYAENEKIINILMNHPKLFELVKNEWLFIYGRVENCFTRLLV